MLFLLRQGTVCGSVQATDRLMKELRDVYRSDSFKRGNLGCDVSQQFTSSLHTCTLKIANVCAVELQYSEPLYNKSLV